MNKYRSKRKSLAILLLTIICLNLFGAPVLFVFMQKKIKKEMKNLIFSQVDTSKLYSFTFPADKFSCEKAGVEFIHEKEFRYNGMMFDVVRSEKQGDSIKYYCVNDKQEEELIAAFARHNKSNKPFNFAAFKLLSNIFISTGSIIEVKCVTESDICFHTSTVPAILAGIKNLPEHPPRHFS
ncbi:MAG: hypothetical protein J0L60_11960 [Ignavibacteria bacterium]|nr:hypothetical protein [Ignavibacteria bacterium]